MMPNPATNNESSYAFVHEQFSRRKPDLIARVGDLSKVTKFNFTNVQNSKSARTAPGATAGEPTALET
jgi:hypothetical protein